jgi:hypothetical protein
VFVRSSMKRNAISEIPWANRARVEFFLPTMLIWLD